MNFTSWKNSKIFYIAFCLIAASAIFFSLFKPALKCFYPVKYVDEINMFSKKYGLREEFVMAIISAESKFQKDAVSFKDAKGLMQLKEETAKWCIEKYGIESDGKSLYLPSINIETGCAYMHYLLEKFGDKSLALAAYNAGEGNVAKWLRDSKKSGKDFRIPFKETRNYVRTVEKREKIYRFLYY